MRTGREIIMAWLQDEIRRASLADLQRAAAFLEFARKVRGGCAKQRARSRKTQSEGWRRHVDQALRW